MAHVGAVNLRISSNRSEKRGLVEGAITYTLSMTSARVGQVRSDMFLPFKLRPLSLSATPINQPALDLLATRNA